MDLETDNFKQAVIMLTLTQNCEVKCMPNGSAVNIRQGHIIAVCALYAFVMFYTGDAMSGL